MRAPIAIFVKHTWVPFMTALALLIGADWLLLKVWVNVPVAVSYVVYWSILTGLFVVLSEFTWRQYSIDETHLLTRLFLIGALMGFCLAIYKSIAYMQLWTLFNLIAEPLRTGLYAILIGWIAANIQRDTINKND